MAGERFLLAGTATMEPDPYAVLGLDPDASRGDVRRAYRRLALELHPDRNPGDRCAADAFKRVGEAYAEVLAMLDAQEPPEEPRSREAELAHDLGEERRFDVGFGPFSIRIGIRLGSLT